MDREYVDLAGVEEVSEGVVRIFLRDGRAIAVGRVDGEIYAVGAVCTHAEFLFESGSLEEGEIVCPAHGARFDMKSGNARRLPAVKALPTYPVRVESGRIFVGIEEE